MTVPKAGQHAQQRRLAAARRAEQSNDLPWLNREIGQPDHLNPRAIGLRVGFLHADGFDDGAVVRRRDCIDAWIDVRIVHAQTPLLSIHDLCRTAKRGRC